MQLDSVDLLQKLQRRACTFQFVPPFVRGPVRHGLAFALSAILDTGAHASLEAVVLVATHAVGSQSWCSEAAQA